MTNIDAMTVRPCRYCGSEVTAKSPDIDYCMHCYYGGVWLNDRFSDLVGVLSQTTPSAWWHTGGGCFALEIMLPDGSYLLACDPEGAAPPDELDGPWLVGRYNSDGGPFSGEDGDYLADGIDSAGLVALVEHLYVDVKAGQ